MRLLNRCRLRRLVTGSQKVPCSVPDMGDTHIKAYCEGMVNSSLCKIASVVLSPYVMEINMIICANNELTIKNNEKSNN